MRWKVALSGYMFSDFVSFSGYDVNFTYFCAELKVQMFESNRYCYKKVQSAVTILSRKQRTCISMRQANKQNTNSS